jgi:transposase
MKDMHVFEREVGGRKYRIAAESLWDAKAGRSVARQVVLGPADEAPVADLGVTRTVGTRSVGDVGALVWVAEQLDVVGEINRACGAVGAKNGPSIGEMVLAVAIQRACCPGPKKDLVTFMDESVPRASCLSAEAFTGQAFHRLASRVTDAHLEVAQVAIATTAVQRFNLSTDVLAFDTSNFDTHIATTTPGRLAKRGHAKSKRADLRVVGLGLLASEKGHVPLLHRTYPGNGSDQSVLESCLDGLASLHDALSGTTPGSRKPERTLVRDGGFWSEQLELSLDPVGYFSLISLPLSHRAAAWALSEAAKPRAMKSLSGRLKDVRAARVRSSVGKLDRTLLVVESKELLEGQKRGIAAALRKAKVELRKLERRVQTGRITRSVLEHRAQHALRREFLSTFVVIETGGSDDAPTFRWHIDTDRRQNLEKTRLGRRVLCTDRHLWSCERIVQAFRGQWNVEELFRRTKKGGVVPWGPSYQWADASLRLHTFATVLGLTLVALARLALGTNQSARAMMVELAGIRATMVRTATRARGRRPTILLAPDLSARQVRAVEVFDLARWMPVLSSCRPTRASRPEKHAAA